eukprot:TRINITY_DN18450_c0_g1_i4.p1 TRINITY_DN18450_c0_g1~~TRINITY_DN18450_c0_g1_i4.p1  ORF type:complete len:746 (+),score=184.17 TRINITY_DN18450_c0_g1_i4:100-2337(+)
MSAANGFAENYGEDRLAPLEALVKKLQRESQAKHEELEQELSVEKAARVAHEGLMNQTIATQEGKWFNTVVEQRSQTQALLDDFTATVETRLLKLERAIEDIGAHPTVVSSVTTAMQQFHGEVFEEIEERFEQHHAEGGYAQFATEAEALHADAEEMREMVAAERRARQGLQELLEGERAARAAHEGMLRDHMGGYEGKLMGHMTDNLGTQRNLLEAHEAEAQRKFGDLSERVGCLEVFLQSAGGSGGSRDGFHSLKEALRHVEETCRSEVGVVAVEISRRLEDVRESCTPAAPATPTTRTPDSTDPEAASQRLEKRLSARLAALEEQVRLDMSRERAARQDQQEAVKEFMASANAARQKYEVFEKNILGDIEKTIRLMVAERKAETESLWDAIHTHVHDLDVPSCSTNTAVSKETTTVPPVQQQPQQQCDFRESSSQGSAPLRVSTVVRSESRSTIHPSSSLVATARSCPGSHVAPPATVRQQPRCIVPSASTTTTTATTPRTSSPSSGGVLVVPKALMAVPRSELLQQTPRTRSPGPPLGPVPVVLAPTVAAPAVPTVQVAAPGQAVLRRSSSRANPYPPSLLPTPASNGTAVIRVQSPQPVTVLTTASGAVPTRSTTSTTPSTTVPRHTGPARYYAAPAASLRTGSSAGRRQSSVQKHELAPPISPSVEMGASSAESTSQQCKLQRLPSREPLRPGSASSQRASCGPATYKKTNGDVLSVAEGSLEGALASLKAVKLRQVLR